MSISILVLRNECLCPFQRMNYYPVHLLWFTKLSFRVCQIPDDEISCDICQEWFHTTYVHIDAKNHSEYTLSYISWPWDFYKVMKLVDQIMINTLRRWQLLRCDKLSAKHGGKGKYTPKQYQCWANLIQLQKHNSYDSPPNKHSLQINLEARWLLLVLEYPLVRRSPCVRSVFPS